MIINLAPRKVLLGNVLLCLLVVDTWSIGPLRPITVDDCIRTRRIIEKEVQISQDARLLAYVVKAPELSRNSNHYQLYVRSLNQLTHRDNGRVILEAESISKVQWLTDDRLAVQCIIKSDGESKTEVFIIDTRSGSHEALGLPEGIEDYSISNDGKVIVFSRKISEKQLSQNDASRKTDGDLRGYRVVYGNGINNSVDKPSDAFEIYLAKRNSSGRLAASRLSFLGPDGAPRRSQLRNVTHLSLSPDAKYLLFSYTADTLPSGWDQLPLIRQIREFGTNGFSYVLALYDVSTGRLRLGFNYPGFAVHAKWAADSLGYAVVSPSPIGTPDARAESDAAVAFGNVFFYLYRFSHVFTVDAKSRKVTRVLSRDSGAPGDIRLWEELPIGWKEAKGTMWLKDSDGSLVRMTMEAQRWRRTKRIEFTEKGLYGSSFASDGERIAGISQSPTIPPNLLLLDTKTERRALLTDLNPDYRNIKLGPVRHIEWTNRFGSKCAGLLITPPDYDPGKRYPLIFMSAGVTDEFISDAPTGTTAYAPQPLAQAGFVVLISHYPIDNKSPKGSFPGDMGSAYNWMAMVEGAIDYLDAQAIIDRHNVGLIGFSRTSWLTDFTLTHSSYDFAAASSADSAIYTYGTYFMWNDVSAMKGYETQIGGPPYGSTLSNWLRYAAPFNADKVGAAVLIETTGPAGNNLEFFVALNRLGKRVEMYDYPNGAHPLNTPLEREASLQRNVDWFRFWMEGYERSDLSAQEQYKRWRAMKAHQLP